MKNILETPCPAEAVAAIGSYFASIPELFSHLGGKLAEAYFIGDARHHLVLYRCLNEKYYHIVHLGFRLEAFGNLIPNCMQHLNKAITAALEMHREAEASGMPLGATAEYFEFVKSFGVPERCLRQWQIAYPKLEADCCARENPNMIGF
ncbi:MAG: hypothetical protein WCI57_00030 [Candidatus Berkelbacteria bacterium]